MISFDNTEIAFEYKSNKALDKAWWLFSFIRSNTLVKLSTPFAPLAVRFFPTRYVIRETLFSHFCGGESISDCDHTINVLHKYGVGTILDYSVEGKESEEDFEQTLAEIMETQHRAQLDDKVPFTVFKLTGMARFALLEKVSKAESLSTAEQTEFERVKQRVEKLCKKAHETGIRIMLDAEETWIQPVLDELILDMMRKYNTEKPLIYNTFQMYLHARLADLKRWYTIAEKEGFCIGVKLVRGAYMEKERKRAEEMGYPSPVQPDKASSDRDYNEALEFIVERLERIGLCAGTHNEESSMLLAELLEKKGIRHDHPNVYFSQLLGMSDHISFNLAHEGYNVAKYVPYGPVKDVLPYLIRRAQENTSVAGQTTRELDLLVKERNRRRRR